MKKTLISGFLTASLALGTVLTGFSVSAVQVHAASFSDIDNHWAKDYILDAANKNIISGYPDGTFLPDKPVTRAEFTKMVNNALGNTAASSISFKDVPAAEWYHGEISKAVAAGYAGGYDTGDFLPNNNISRQEAAVMLSRIVPTYNYNASLTSYGDRASVSDWAESSLSRIVGKKYMGAYDDGNLHPLDNLTRAQAAKIICDIVDNETIVKNALTISEEDTKVSNKIYSNGITINKNVGEGDVTIDNCVVLGSLYVQGGGAGESSKDGEVTINNSRVASCQISKTASAVLVHAKNETRILETSAYKTTHLHTSSLKNGLFGTGFDKITLFSGSETHLDGNFPAVTVNGADCHVNFESGTITTFNVETAGKNSEVSLDSYATITTANVNAVSSFRGKGAIRTMNANESGITYENKPSTINTKSGKTAPKYTDEDLDISVTPRRGDDNVDIDSTIKISFSSAITKYSNGKTPTTSDLEKLIELRRKSTSGTKVDFTASINSSKKTVTITPDSDLDEDTRYYVIIDANTFKYSDGKGNAAFQTYFNTGDGDESSVDGISISPKNKATGVSISRPTIKITFDSSMKTYSSSGSGSSISKSNAEDRIELHRDKSTGSEVAFTVTSASSTTISIRPDSNLRYDTDYYVVIPKNKFMDSKKNGNDKFTSYFTTEKETVSNSVSKITTSSTDEKSIKVSVSVSSTGSGKIYGILLPSGDSAPNASRIKNGEDGKGTRLQDKYVKQDSISRNGTISWTFSDLDSNTSYKLHTVLEVGSITSSVKSSDVIKTETLPGVKLTGLKMQTSDSDLKLSPTFSSNTTEYKVAVPFGSSSVTIKATPESQQADVNFRLNGNRLTSDGSGNITIDNLLSNKENEVEIAVSDSESNKKPTTYTVLISISGKTGADIDILCNDVPVQKAGSEYYVPFGTKSVTIKVIAEDKDAVIQCSSTPSKGTGELEGVVSLNDTSTNLECTVTSNSDSQTYRLVIKQLDPQ